MHAGVLQKYLACALMSQAAIVLFVFADRCCEVHQHIVSVMLCLQIRTVTCAALQVAAQNVTAVSHDHVVCTKCRSRVKRMHSS